MKIRFQTLVSLVGICSWCAWADAGTVSILLTPAEVDVKENNGGSFDVFLNNNLTLPNGTGADVSVPIQLDRLGFIVDIVLPIIDMTDAPIDMMITADGAQVAKVDPLAVPVTDPISGALTFTTPGGTPSFFLLPKQTGFHFTLTFGTDKDLPELPVDHQLWRVDVGASYRYFDFNTKQFVSKIATTADPGGGSGLIDVTDTPEPTAFVIWTLVMGIFGAGSLRMRLKRNKTAA
jgi:hypothetical protein